MFDIILVIVKIITWCRTLRQKFLIIDNFVPTEERSRLIHLAQFDENSDNWILKKDNRLFKLNERPLAHNYRRPISDYTITHAIPSTGIRYRVSIFI